jgi:hypothetical protein
MSEFQITFNFFYLFEKFIPAAPAMRYAPDLVVRLAISKALTIDNSFIYILYTAPNNNVSAA